MGGNQVFIQYAHRFYAEFAREAMSNQMDLFEGQKDPLLIKWAAAGSGNPFDFASEEDKAKFEIAQIKASQKRRKVDLTNTN